jgi:hypothetical protein
MAGRWWSVSQSVRMFEGTTAAVNTAIFPAPAVLDRQAPALEVVNLPASPEAAAGQAVFLHTGWRSGGTWIWSRCRASTKVCGYYEPLHEQAARFRRHDVASMRPGSWQSNHSETAPYFEEYRDLIPARGRGVAQYQARFAFDGFFRAPGDPGDAALEAYVGSLMTRALAEGQLPVMKFCRSMGRVGWFAQRFPNALHAVVLRDPLAQFQSGQHLLHQQRNRYFSLAPMLVLARNAHHPAVREAALALGVGIPTLYSDDIDYAVEACWLHVRRVSAAEQYRGFLVFWTLCATSALESEALVIDADGIRTDPEHRRAIEAALQGRIGEPISLMPRLHKAASDSPPPGWQEAHAAAASLARTRRDRLSPERLDVIIEKLGSEAAGELPRWSPPHLPAAAGPPHPTRHALTAAEVLLARALQPLRRLHGSLLKREAHRT